MISELLSSFLPNSVANVLSTIIIFIGISVGIYLIGRVTILPTFKKLLKGNGVEEHARNPIMKVSWFILVLVSVTIGFGSAGLGNFLTALATISAAGTLAIGFAMQNIIKNFVSGVFIFIDQPFKIGDWIEWNDYSGRVEDIEMRLQKLEHLITNFSPFRIVISHK